MATDKLCPTCGAHRLTARFVSTKLHEAMASAKESGDRFAAEQRAKGVWLAGAGQSHQLGALEQLLEAMATGTRFMCQCEPEEMPAPKRSIRPVSTWTEHRPGCRKPIEHPAGRVPDVCPECGKRWAA